MSNNGIGLAAARVLSRRMYDRARYRRRRDRKIAVDWVGNLLTYDSLVWRLAAYDPRNHTITLLQERPYTGTRLVWSTDTLWKRIKNGEVSL